MRLLKNKRTKVVYEYLCDEVFDNKPSKDTGLVWVRRLDEGRRLTIRKDAVVEVE